MWDKETLRKWLVSATLIASAISATPAWPQSAATPPNGSSESIWARPELFAGNWRDELREAGIDIDVWVTQFYQGATAGMGNHRWRYGGRGDILVTIDGEKLGLWPGFFVTAHAELLYGEGANAVGSGLIIPVNTGLAFPRQGGSDQNLSLVVTQAFSESVILSVGKFNMLDVAARTPLMGGGGIDTFMNMGLAAPISGIIPPYLIGANLTVKTDPVVLTAMIYDHRNAQDGDVLAHPFAEGVTGLIGVTAPVQIAGRSGFYGVRAVYSTKKGADLSDVQGLPPGSERLMGFKEGSWFLGASFQQYLVQDPDDPRKGWGVFGQFGVSDGNPNLVAWSAIFGVGGTSFIPGRDMDRWGIAYFRYSISPDLKAGLASRGLRLRDEQGVEAFYNLAVTPWLMVTADVQVVSPLVASAPTAVTTGLRAQLKF
jgi:porin